MLSYVAHSNSTEWANITKQAKSPIQNLQLCYMQQHYKVWRLMSLKQDSFCI